MKLKLPIIIILLCIIAFNFYSFQKYPDKYTQAKINFSSFTGSTSYLGRIDFWHLLVQNGDWNNASFFENKLNQDQVADYKLNHQPEQIKKKINELEMNDEKTSDNYVQLAKNQSLLGQNQQAIDSIKKAHQLDLIRSDIDKLFYSISQ
jgi:hypothetical protein